MFEKLPQLRTTNSICAVNGYGAAELTALHSHLQRRCNFLVVTLLAWRPILIYSPFRIETSGDIVQLGGCQQLVVCVLGFGDLESLNQDRNEVSS